MNVTRQDFFTGAGLARNQHRGIAAGHAGRQLQQLHAGRFDGHRALRVSRAHTAERMACHQLQQRLGFKRLDQVIRRALTHGVHRALHRAVGGHQQHRQLGLPRPQQGEQLVTVHARHVDVADHQTERFGRDRLQRFFSRPHGAKPMPGQQQSVG